MKYRNLSAPITAHVEITDACNEKCLHCYNFCRDEKKDPPRTMTQERLGFVVKELVANKVMHTIITGGEPMCAIDSAVSLAEQAINARMTVSLNSNLYALSPDRILRLKDAGVPHILTTIHSARAEEHDRVTQTPGSFRRTLANIRLAQEHGVRVTVNTILSQNNKDEIYDIGHTLWFQGVRKYLVNRTIPSPSNANSLKEQYVVDKKTMLAAYDDLLRLKAEYGMQIGTCRTVPLCFFPDMEKYKDFWPRGCAAGKRHVIIQPDGGVRTCVSETTVYGNIYEVGLAQCWRNMEMWRSNLFIPPECAECHLLEQCHAGCRMVALHCTGKTHGCDNLRNGFEYRQEDGFRIARKMDGGAKVEFVDE